MSFRKEISAAAFGWTVGVAFSPGWLAVEVAWETSPPGLFLMIPFVCLWVERAQTNHRQKPWSWGWSLLRLTVWKTEFRLDLDLNIWGIGLNCVEWDDCGIYVGPFNLQIEMDKMFDVDFPAGVPTLRLLFPADSCVPPWSSGCDCDPLNDDLEVGGVFDSASTYPTTPSAPIGS
jgi:hypothetical protein